MKTIQLAQEYRYEQTIKKSRFIACIKPCYTEEECRNYIQSIQKEYKDANHVCTAFICGEHDEIQRSSDNHEPSGTAGIPMLKAIQEKHMHNVCACVVRYFGGIKLGTGGLTRAYHDSVQLAFANAPMVEIVPAQIWRIHYPYSLTGTIEPWLRGHTTIISQGYTDQETVLLIETTSPSFKEDIINLTSNTVQPEYVKDTFIQQPVISQ